MKSRQHFLKSSSALIALPFLESIGNENKMAAKPPKRMIFLSFGWGVTRESWFPNCEEVGKKYALTKGLKPLKRHKQDITIIQGLHNQFNNEAHWGSTFYLTGANRYGVPGQSFHNTISADQVAAEKFGTTTRYTSIQLSCVNGTESGHGPGLSLAWNRQGKPVAGITSPLALYHKLFSDEKIPLEQRQSMLAHRKSILDTVLVDAKSLRHALTKTDIDKLEEYFQSIRDIETRLQKEEQWLSVPKVQPKQPLTEPREDINGIEEIELMYDLMLAALQTDATRVLSYRQPVDTLLKAMGASITGHNMSHYQPGMRQEVSEKRDQKQSELLARFIDKLKSSKENDGSSLYDHISLSYGSNIQSIHYLDNCPTLISGGAANINHGQHLVMKNKTPLCNLWLSLLKGCGIEVESHGDSTGVIKELWS